MAVADLVLHRRRAAASVNPPAARGRCAARAARDPKAAMREAAKQFETLFMQQLLKSMRDSTHERGHDGQRGHEDGHRDARLAVGRARWPACPAGCPTSSRASSSARWASRQGADRQAARPPTRRRSTRCTPTRPSRCRRRPPRLRRRRTPTPPRAAEKRRPASRPTFMIAQAAHETGWGRKEIRNADGTTSYNLFGIKAGAGWKGAVADDHDHRVHRRQGAQGDANFRAYASYAESFADYASMMKDSPRYAARASAAGAASDAQRLRAGPAEGRLRDRPGLRRQAGRDDPHDGARAARWLTVTHDARRADRSDAWSAS